MSKRDEKLDHIASNYVNGNLSYTAVKIRLLRKVEIAYLLINIEQFVPDYNVDRFQGFIMSSLEKEI